MQSVGIIAEYNPFHNGHAWQIGQARRLGAQTVVVVMSSGLVQRGGLPLLPESTRVQAALLAGADVVLELPAPCAGSGAEHFAASGAALLAAAGCDTLLCGTEYAEKEAVLLAARVLNTPEYTAALKAALGGGARSFAAAREQAFAAAANGMACPPKIQPDQLLAVLQSPNNNLAVEYARAILRQNSGMDLCVLPRIGVAHDAEQSGAAGEMPVASASRLRALWAEGGARAVAPYTTANAAALYAAAERSRTDIDSHAFDLAILSRLRAAVGEETRMSPAFADIRGVNEGLDCALKNAVRFAPTAGALCDSLTTVRYPRARMRRLVMDAALHITPDLQRLPPYLHILGARRAALPLLKNCGLPVSVSLADLAKKSPECAAFATVQARSADLAALCRRAPQGMGSAFSTPCVLL